MTPFVSKPNGSDSTPHHLPTPFLLTHPAVPAAQPQGVELDEPFGVALVVGAGVVLEGHAAAAFGNGGKSRFAFTMPLVGAGHPALLTRRLPGEL